MKASRNYILYICGLFISLFGTNVYTFAIGLYVLKITGSPTSFALTLILGILPVVLIGPFTGVFVDQRNKQYIVVASDLFNGLLFAALFIVAKNDQLSLPIIYATTFLVSVTTTFFDTSMQASKVLLFDSADLEKVNATSQVVRSAAIITAPVLGGFAYSFFNISLFILVNGLSFIYSAGIELLLKYPPYIKQISPDGDSSTAQFKEGLRYVSNHKSLHPFILYFIVLNFTIGLSLNVPMPYIINTVLKQPPSLLGSIQAFFPVGLLIGGLLISKLMRRASYNRILRYVNYLFALLLLCVALPGYLPHSFLSYNFLLIYYGSIDLLFGMGISFVDVPIITKLQTEVAHEYQGRVLGLVSSLVKAIYPFGLAMSSILLGFVNAFNVPLIGALITVLFTFYFTIASRKETSKVLTT